MPSAKTADWPDDILTDEEAVFRLQEILLANVEGARDSALNYQYQRLRKAFRENDEYSEILPRLIRVHADLGGLWSYMKSVASQWEPRRQHVREEMKPLFNRSEEIADRSIYADPPWPGRANSQDAADWTGMLSPTQRLGAAKSLLPVARASIERLIQHLSRPNHNGAPPLDETEEAVANLRNLHRALGEILEGLESGGWEAVWGQGLPQAASRYAKRAARALRDDPVPYAMSAMLLSVLTACGFPGVGAWLASVAVAVKDGPSN